VAWSQNAGKKLQAVEQEIQKSQDESARQRARADALKSEIDTINIDLVEAAQRVQQQEVQVAMLEGELSRLEREAALKNGKLRERRQQFSGVVMALSRIARFPTEALIAQPIPPEDTVRSAILLRAAVPAIETRAQMLKGEIENLNTTRSQVESRRLALQGALETLQVEEDRINAIRKRKAALRAEAISKSRVATTEARKLGKQAKSLRDLVGRLDAQKKKTEKAALAKVAKKTPSNTRPTSGLAAPAPSAAELKALGNIALISKARGHLPFPATGRLVGLYGQALEGGLASKGISIATRASGQVISPFDGKVVFAGPFRGYGQLLIIDHGEGYHSLLAGLGRIDVEIGQPVLAGEPVSLMSEKGGLDGGAEPVLYVEFRRDNQPINPLPWLVARKGKPKG
jgi:septal ring factor EnvC (AmiA/AmiB activator)